jgi:hypothetical protein
MGGAYGAKEADLYEVTGFVGVHFVRAYSAFCFNFLLYHYCICIQIVHVLENLSRIWYFMFVLVKKGDCSGPDRI